MHRRLFSLPVLLLCGCFNSLLITPTQVDGPLQETIVCDADHWYCRDKIAMIDVSGMILNAHESSMLGGDGDNMMATFRERLDAAADDPHVKAVLIRINSPGGAVTASDIMYHDLVQFRKETGKPVVACMMDVAASGAYYLAVGCDRVYAHPTTVTGSIGVIMNLYNASGLVAKLGVSSDAIKSGPNKDIGNPLRPMTEQERALLQSMVNAFYDQFVHVVVKGRKMPEERIRVLADGRVYTGIEAKQEGLVDEVGYLEDALDCAKALACLKDASVIAYDRCAGYKGSIYARMPNIPSKIQVKLDLPGLPTGKGGAAFLYMWEPGLAN